MDITLGSTDATTVEPTTTAEPEPTTTAEEGIASWASDEARGRRGQLRDACTLPHPSRMTRRYAPFSPKA